MDADDLTGKAGMLLECAGGSFRCITTDGASACIASFPAKSDMAARISHGYARSLRKLAMRVSSDVRLAVGGTSVHAVCGDEWLSGRIVGEAFPPVEKFAARYREDLVSSSVDRGLFARAVEVAATANPEWIDVVFGGQVLVCAKGTGGESSAVVDHDGSTAALDLRLNPKYLRSMMAALECERVTIMRRGDGEVSWAMFFRADDAGVSVEYLVMPRRKE